MNVFAITTGAYLLGWLVPEFVLMLSPHADNFKSVPMGINVACALGVALIAYGIAA